MIKMKSVIYRFVFRIIRPP